MAAIKITSFAGLAPKVSAELLPPSAAQTAENTKLYSGDIIPYPRPAIVAVAGYFFDQTTSIFALRDPATGALKWISWNASDGDVDVAILTSSLDTDQRFYYTDGTKPKASNYELAVNAAGQRPAGAYDLGLELPERQPTTSVTAFTEKTSSSVARDTAGVTTIVTSAAHELKTGSYVAISGFAYITATYNQAAAGTLITVTRAGHGFSEGATITLDFQTVAGGTVIPPDGVYTITNVTANTFDISIAVATTVISNGNVRIDIRGYNATNAQVTVVNSTTFRYFSPGAAQSTYTISDGRINLGGVQQARTYAYTWWTPWEEESIASKPSDTIFVKEGQTVTIGSLPRSGDTHGGSTQIYGLQLYRTLPSASATEYFRIQTLLFPDEIHHVRRTSGVVRIQTYQIHEFEVGDRVRIGGLRSPLNVFNGDHVITAVDDFHFDFALAGADVPQTNVRSTNVAATWTGTSITVSLTAHGYVLGQKVHLHLVGAWTATSIESGVYTVTSVPGVNSFVVAYSRSSPGIYVSAVYVGGYAAYDVSEDPPTTTARYFEDNGSGDYTFIDDFDSLALTTTLASDSYAPPPDDLQGLISHKGNLLVGFFGNTVCFSELNQPHAWPIEYRKVVDYPVVGLVSISGYVVVLTEGYPYTISVSDPAANVSIARVEALYPCLNRRSIVNMGYGIVYATHDGLAVFSFSGGTQIITRNLQNNDTWNAQLSPATLKGIYYGSNYFGSHSTGSIIFEREEKVGFFVTTPEKFTAAWYDSLTGRLYYKIDLGLPAVRTGTYTQVGTLITVSVPLSGGIVGHLLQTGDVVSIDFITGGAVDGIFTVTILSPTDFTVTAAAPLTTSGSVWYSLNEVVYEWDNLSRPLLTQTWKSKVFKTRDFVNIGAARVIADYNNFWEDIDQQWQLYDPLGNGGLWESLNTLEFKLFVDKSLFATVSVSTSDMFRLPTGYLSDTFEVSVAGQARIREIQIAETPTDLRTV